ncbi:MAG TPA: hypothetical protein VIA98_11245 [Allosphingosinicella sp.]|jgi:hypothetical protein
MIISQHQPVGDSPVKSFWSFSLLLIGAALLATPPAAAEKVQLSKRTAEKYRELKEHVTDANQRIVISNVILGFVPFVPLLGGADSVTTIEIATTDYASLGEASANINSIFRSQLKQFCQLEALSQHDSPADYRFWLDLADSFDGKKTFFPGTWENRQGPDIIRAVFSEPGRALALKVDGSFSSSSMSFPVSGLTIQGPRSVSFDMNSGGDIFKCSSAISADRKKLTMTCRDTSGRSEVTSFDRAA